MDKIIIILFVVIEVLRVFDSKSYLNYYIYSIVMQCGNLQNAVVCNSDHLNVS